MAISVTVDAELLAASLAEDLEMGEFLKLALEDEDEEAVVVFEWALLDDILEERRTIVL